MCCANFPRNEEANIACSLVEYAAKAIVSTEMLWQRWATACNTTIFPDFVVAFAWCLFLDGGLYERNVLFGVLN